MKRRLQFVALLALAACWAGCESAGRPSALIEVGERAPAIEAVGWVNGAPPSSEELLGQVVVIDCWATWCGPCELAAPELVETYLRYRQQGVQFVGLTSEPSTQVEAIQAFTTKYSVTWPNGYGAGPALAALGVQAVPTLIVVGRDGRVAATIVGFEPGKLERVLQDVLDAPYHQSAVAF